MRPRSIALVVALIVPAMAGCTAPSTDPGPGIGSDPAAGPCQGTFNATVSWIADGDTLAVEECDPLIRLALVDTPERGEDGYEEARNFTAGLCPVGLAATVDRDAGQPRDTTGERYVAVVLCGGENLNAALLEAGHAVVLTRFCDDSEFSDDDWARPHCG